MCGEAQMANTTGLLLLKKIVHDAKLGVKVLVDILLAHVVDEVEVKELHPRLLELLLEDLLDLVHIVDVVTGELGRDHELIASVAVKRDTHGNLGLAIVVTPCGVEIVHATIERVVNHLVDGILVDLGIVVIDHRQAHGPKPERGELLALKVLIQHRKASQSTYFRRHRKPLSVLQVKGGRASLRLMCPGARDYPERQGHRP